MRQEHAYERFNIHHRLQHMMMFSSFILLTVTGLPIKYSEAGWAAVITGLFGGFDRMFTAHLIGASVMIASAVYHVVYLILSALRGQLSAAMFPTPGDVRDLLENVAYHLGLRQSRAQYDRYSYKEKFDYWAVFWGMAIMVGSGLMMWFPDWATRCFPRWVIDASRFAHSDEAMLAILAIFVWHFYNVHVNPDCFPINTVWLTGRMSAGLMEHEHPRELARCRDRLLPSSGVIAPAASGRFNGSRRLVIVQMVAYAAALAWFLWVFLPVGLK